MRRGFIKPALLVMLALIVAGALVATTYYGLQAFSAEAVAADRVDHVLIAGDNFPDDDEALLAALRSNEPRPASVTARRVPVEVLAERNPEAFGKASAALDGLILRIEGTKHAVSAAAIRAQAVLDDLGYHYSFWDEERDPRSQAEWLEYKQRIAHETGELFYVSGDHPQDDAALRRRLGQVEGLELLALERISMEEALARHEPFSNTEGHILCDGPACVVMVVGFRSSGYHGDLALPSVLREAGYRMDAYGYARLSTQMRD